MPSSSLDPKHPLLQKVPYSNAPGSYEELYRLAWRDKNRDALFEKVYDNNGQPAVDPQGVQYTSLKAFFEFDDDSPKRILITSEYRVARADAERWFGGQDIAEPIFFPEDSDWNRWALPKDARMDLDEIEAKPSSSPKNNSPPPASHQTFIVIGMPGIGKTLFLHYLLVERLLQEQPTCLQTEPGWFTFWCHDGVFTIEVDTKVEILLSSLTGEDKVLRNVWYLIDSNESLIKPESFVKVSGARIVQATSPRQNRIKWTGKKSSMHYLWFMKPSPLRELLIMKQFQVTDATTEQYEYFYRTYGPSARLLSQYAAIPEEFEEELLSKIQDLNLPALKDLIRPVQKADPGIELASHWVFGLFPGIRRNRPIVDIYTRELYRLVQNAFDGKWDEHKHDAYRLFKSQPQTHGPAGYILEDQLHKLLQGGSVWELTELVVRSKRGRTNNVYYRSKSTSMSKLLVIGPGARIIDTTAQLPMTSALVLHRYPPANSDEGWFAPGYYQPTSSNQATFDSYIVNVDHPDKSIFAFQFTVAEDHDVKPEGMNWLQQTYPGYEFHYIAFTDNQSVRIPIPKTHDHMWKTRWHVLVKEDELFSQM